MKKRLKNKIQATLVAILVVVAVVFVIFVQLFLNEKVQINLLATKHQITCNKADNKCYIYKKIYKKTNYEYVGSIIMSNIDVLECEKNKRLFDLKDLNAANSFYKIKFNDPINKFTIGQFKDLDTCNIEKKKLIFKLNSVQGNENITIYRAK